MEYGWKGKKYNLPTTLREVTLRQKIEFDSIYREEIMRLQDEVFKTDENGDDLPVDEIDVQMLNINVAVMNISFFTGIPIEEINREMCIEDIMTLYYSCFDQMYSDQEIEFDTVHMFKEEFWQIAAPELTHQSGVTFNEFIISKQIVKQIQELGGGKWDVLPALAAVYLRKENESFNESFIAPGSERLELMYDLTLDIALQVAFFFGKFNEFVSDNFSVFGGGSSSGGPNLKEHFDKWGWLSFLTYVAEKGSIFYRTNGKSNLENIKETKAYDILIWASEQKDHEEFIQEYYESLKK